MEQLKKSTGEIRWRCKMRDAWGMNLSGQENENKMFTFDFNDVDDKYHHLVAS